MVTDWLNNWMMPSDKHNSTTVTAMGLLLGIALAWNVFFDILQYVQSTHDGLTFVSHHFPLFNQVSHHSY